jgi:RNA polymerase sigma factor FliA
VNATNRALLIERHLPLVGRVVTQVAVHFPRFVERQELARAGTLGLVEAASRYDERRCVPFERFAAQRIRGAILDSVRSSDWAPRSLRAMARQLEEVEHRLLGEQGEVPSAEQVAKAMGLTIRELHELKANLHRSVVLALERVVSAPGEDATLAELFVDRSAVEPHEALERRELVGYLRDAVDLLPERHRRVIVGYFLDGLTSKELADELDVTESRISQLRSDALTMLKDGIVAQYRLHPVPAPGGRVERRQARYAAAIGNASDWRDRLDPASIGGPAYAAR